MIGVHRGGGLDAVVGDRIAGRPARIDRDDDGAALSRDAEREEELAHDARGVAERPVAERPYAAVTVGLAVAFVAGFIPLVTAILSILGIGAVVLAAWRTLRAGTAPVRALGAQPQPAG